MLTAAETKAFYDHFGQRQDSQGFYEDLATADLIEHADFEQAFSIFEYGCGTGRLAATLLEHHLPDQATYRAVDISSTMIDLASKRLSGFGQRVALEQVDGRPITRVEDHSVDRFVSTFVVDLLSGEDIRALLDEAHRLLKVDGALALVNLTHGFNISSRLVIGFWTLLHRLRPSWVGGCRPIDIIDFLPESRWRCQHYRRLSRWGVAMQVAVAKPLWPSATAKREPASRLS